MLVCPDVEREIEFCQRVLGAARRSVLLAAQDQFWGDRSARVMDPSGHVWNLASRSENTTEEQRRGL
jgi:uncharacterized glyoxalase superfamily protein PhnB